MNPTIEPVRLAVRRWSRQVVGHSKPWLELAVALHRKACALSMPYFELRYVAARSRLARISLACAAVAILPLTAHAQPSGRVVALATQTPDAGGDARVDDRLRNALEDIEGIDLAKYPAVDLETVQLAIDCVDETPRCLRAVAERVGADVLLAPSVEFKGGQGRLKYPLLRRVWGRQAEVGCAPQSRHAAQRRDDRRDSGDGG